MFRTFFPVLCASVAKLWCVKNGAVDGPIDGAPGIAGHAHADLVGSGVEQSFVSGVILCDAERSDSADLGHGAADVLESADPAVTGGTGGIPGHRLRMHTNGGVIAGCECVDGVGGVVSE